MMYDFSPLYRSTVGFERLANLLADSGEPAHNWPPYNVERIGQDSYRIVMALAGYSPEELDIVQQTYAVTITGRKEAGSADAEVLHRGIVARSFRKTFQLADYVKVKQATFEGGLLTVELVREVPEPLRPRRIEINRDAKQPPRVEQSKAA